MANTLFSRALILKQINFRHLLNIENKSFAQQPQLTEKRLDVDVQPLHFLIKKNNIMKKVSTSPFLLVLLMLCGLNISAQKTQQLIYKQVEIVMDDDSDLERIATLGIDLICGANMTHKNGKHLVTLELSTDEIALLENDNLQPKILIEDLADFYAKRAVRDLPKAREDLRIAKAAALHKNAEAGQDLGCSEDGFPVPQNFVLGSMAGMYTYQEMLTQLGLMSAAYPNLITAPAPISTTNTTIEGRDVFYLKISDNPNVDENEAEVLYTGVHHAREPVSMMNLIYYMWYLLENYATDPKVKNIVDNTELYFIPVVNPDGYLYNELTNPNGGGFWRKNRRINGDGSEGVDLNRNYGYQWGVNNSGSSPTPSSSTYRGTAPFSEPETQMVRDFVQSHNFVNAFNNHCYSNIMIHPWGYTPAPTAEVELLDELSEQMCWHNRYDYGNADEIIYPVNGEANDWFYGAEDILAWTPELGAAAEGGFWPSPTFIVPQCERQMKMSLILAASAANYGIINDLTPYDLDPANPTLTFSVEHLSNVDGGFTISVSSTSPYVTAIANPALSTGMLTQANFATVSTGVTIAAGTPQGAPITFDVVLNNGTYDIHTTSITKAYNAPTIFSDDGTNLNNWTSSAGWGVTNSTGYNSSSSITDSPTGNMSTTSRTLTLSAPVDLSGVQSPVLEYYTKWDIARLFDYVQIEASTNGTSWTDLCGTYTKPGTSPNNVWSGSPDQPTGEGLYDGFQKEWVREEIDLSTYAGISTLYLRFKADGDTEKTQLDGFYFDDFKIYADAQACASLGLDIRFDNTPGQTSWEITDANGNVVASSGGTYSGQIGNNTLSLTPACLPDGCYDLIFYDAIGNGMCPFQSTASSSGTFITPGTLIASGSIVATLGTVVSPAICGNYQLYDASGNLIVSGGAGFGTSETNNFCLTNGIATRIVPNIGGLTAEHQPKIHTPFLTVYPTLASEFITIHYNSNDDTQINIIDINGRILQQHSRDKHADPTFTINIADMPTGIHFIQIISTNGLVMTEKFIKE